MTPVMLAVGTNTRAPPVMEMPRPEGITVNVTEGPPRRRRPIWVNVERTVSVEGSSGNGVRSSAPKMLYGQGKAATTVLGAGVLGVLGGWPMGVLGGALVGLVRGLLHK